MKIHCKKFETDSCDFSISRGEKNFHLISIHSFYIILFYIISTHLAFFLVVEINAIIVHLLFDFQFVDCSTLVVFYVIQRSLYIIDVYIL